MKCLEKSSSQWLLEAEAREKQALEYLTGLYPVMSAAQHQVTKGESNDRLAECQALLEQALEERQRECRNWVQAFWNEPGRFEIAQSRIRFRLDPARAEWLLEVLNDVRVGSWMKLGSPDTGQLRQILPTPAQARLIWAMEASGHFQMELLRIIQAEPG